MRILKIIFLTVFLPVVGILAFIFAISPVMWYSDTRCESIRVLTSARSTGELTNAVGHLGVVIPLTNNAWIAIRYRDIHSLPIVSCAVARDSGGGWFESSRHFCGSLSFWPRLKMEIAADEEQRKLSPDWFTNRVSRADLANSGTLASYKEMIAIESAPDLESARRALQKVGFKKFSQ